MEYILIVGPVQGQGIGLCGTLGKCMTKNCKMSRCSNNQGSNFGLETKDLTCSSLVFVISTRPKNMSCHWGSLSPVLGREGVAQLAGALSVSDSAAWNVCIGSAELASHKAKNCLP